MVGVHAGHASLPAALQGKSEFRMIRYCCLCLDRGAQGIAYFYVSVDHLTPHVFHVFLPVPTVADQDFQSSLSHRTHSHRGSES